MKLGKLLVAGKSIMSGRTEVSYRSSKQIYLPKFGSAKNPFKTDGSSPVTETALPAETSFPKSGTPSVPAKNCVSQASVAPSQPNIVHDGRASAPQCFNAAARSSSQLPVADRQAASPTRAEGGSTQPGAKLNPFAMLRAAFPLGKAGGSGKGGKNDKGTATQTELSLDAVKVVHNDLSDVDVEVVPIKSRSTPAELAPQPRKPWEYVGERLFGVETT